MPSVSNSETVVEEACLIARMGVGDRDAFRELYGRYSSPLFSLAVRMVGDFGQAEELVQDTFVKIWRNASAFDPRKSRPFTWAVTIARRTCIDHLRKRRHQPVTTPFVAEEAVTHGLATGENVRSSAEGREDVERLRGALAEVPSNPRRALELVLFTELTQSEIAERLQQPEGTVKSWIRRGLIDLRKAITEGAP